MKKLCAAVIIFAAALVCTAVWFSPLIVLGAPAAYKNNVEVKRVEGLCYSQSDVVRVDIAGDIEQLYAALERINATVVMTAEIDGATIVYAYSPRVAAKTLTTSDGQQYNVMAACGGGTVKIGAPVLQGSF